MTNTSTPPTRLASVNNSLILDKKTKLKVVYDNVIINAKIGIRYDARAYEGIDCGWYKNNVNIPTSGQWKLMKYAQA